MNFENKTKVLVLSLAISTMILAAGCGMKENLDDMHDKTKHMADTTDKLADTSGDMSTKMDKTIATSGKIFDISNDLFDGSKVAMIVGTHRDFFNYILNDKDMGNKLADGAGFFYTLSYQIYKGSHLDTVKKQNEYKEVSVVEFLERSEYLMQPLAWYELPMGNDRQTLLALAGTMGRIYPTQADDGAANGFQPVSMLSMFQEALDSLRLNPNAPMSKLPDYLATLRSKHESMVKILQARLNFIAIFVYGEITGLGRQKTWTGLREAMRHGNVGGLFKSRDVTQNIYFHDKNLTQIEKYNFYLRNALRTKKMLIDFNKGAQLDTDANSLWIGKIFKNMESSWSQYQPHYPKPVRDQIAPTFKVFQTLVKALNMNEQDFSKVDPDLYSHD
jgi:hypothetical protein